MSPREEADQVTSQITLVRDLESQTVRLPGWGHLACFSQWALKEEVDMCKWLWGSWGRMTFQWNQTEAERVTAAWVGGLKLGVEGIMHLCLPFC